MSAYIVLEPSLQVLRVPNIYAQWPAIQWPPERNVMPEKKIGEPAAIFYPEDFYYRHTLTGTAIAVFVRSTLDANKLPEPVVAAIRAMDAEDGQE